MYPLASVRGVFYCQAESCPGRRFESRSAALTDAIVERAGLHVVDVPHVDKPNLIVPDGIVAYRHQPGEVGDDPWRESGPVEPFHLLLLQAFGVAFGAGVDHREYIDGPVVAVELADVPPVGWSSLESGFFLHLAGDALSGCFFAFVFAAQAVDEARLPGRREFMDEQHARERGVKDEADGIAFGHGGDDGTEGRQSAEGDCFSVFHRCSFCVSIAFLHIICNSMITGTSPVIDR